MAEADGAETSKITLWPFDRWWVGGPCYKSKCFLNICPHSDFYIFYNLRLEPGRKCGSSFNSRPVSCLSGCFYLRVWKEKSGAAAIKNPSADSYRAICGRQADNGRIVQCEGLKMAVYGSVHGWQGYRDTVRALKMAVYGSRVALLRACPHGAYEQIWDNTSKSINLDHPHY